MTGNAATPDFTYAEKPGHLDVTCTRCGDGIDAPDQGLGRAMVAAWKTQHQHREDR